MKNTNGKKKLSSDSFQAVIMLATVDSIRPVHLCTDSLYFTVFFL